MSAMRCNSVSPRVVGESEAMRRICTKTGEHTIHKSGKRTWPDWPPASPPRKPPAPLTVEECVYWLAVVAATGHYQPKDIEWYASKAIVRRDMKELADCTAITIRAARRATTTRGYGDGRLGQEARAQCLTVWALCRAAARAVASERNRT